MYLDGGRLEQLAVRLCKGMRGSILYLLNVSNPDRMSSDSGWIFADIMASALVDHGIDVILSGPVPVTDARVGFVPAARPRNKYEARFSFDVQECSRLLKRIRPSVVAVNQLEHATSVRAAMLEARVEAVLAGYCHYVPFFLDGNDQLVVDPSLDDRGLGQPIMLRFMSGLLSCDRVMVHSEAALDWIERMADRLSADLTSRLRIVPPPRDPRLTRPTQQEAPRVSSNSRPAVAIYNHRLYEHYGTKAFVALASRLVTKRHLRLMVLDVLGARTPDRISLDSSPERYLRELAALTNVEIASDRGDRSCYRSFLERANFAFAPLRPGCTWSMSVIDCQAMGLPVISPRLGWFPERVDPDLLFDEAHEAISIAERLATDHFFWTRHSIRAQQATQSLSPELVAAKYLTAVSC